MRAIGIGLSFIFGGPGTPAAPAAPAVVSAPVILGTPTVGTPVSFVPAAFSGSPLPSVTRQWTLDGVDIGGATGTTYTPVIGDVGGLLRIRETATNTEGSISSTSAPVAVQDVAVTSYHLTRGSDTLTTRAGDRITYR
jgi:hypothetical protein